MANQLVGWHAWGPEKVRPVPGEGDPTATVVIVAAAPAQESRTSELPVKVITKFAPVDVISLPKS